ncbi:TetR/AcrR family transcriptional regulator [Frankia sp. CNm7]|uniref:TetR/AcrR family transcriptional regulator n=1 Tax=Frankia nepalensis TaxID=1836974 RepID=A0A937UMP8_9ACTN|nr:TetR/AcrR family transcriptional regulator [Frankia nepalensis]MBL7499767.1 TetR/AcrR family transcriptional regulator [Frankia nepalensis]MBL7512252.1 TetR/AcrR family transcriptional regulator [Frankia nepalensis]MBL7524088.1 TetR/AcrR family transcriptional regulator [Frankia nepalensis]MBL7629054.1 TetR/AcrR family transcriptional regulator [Frankia nepalensis]
MTTRSQQHRREQAAVARERLLDAAEVRFGRDGYRATSLRDVAEACGISVGALYLHLSGKEELLRAVIDRRSVVLLARIASFAEEDGPGIDRLTGLAHAEIEFYRHHPDFGRIIGRLFPAGQSLVPQLSADLAEGYRGVLHLQAEIIRQGQRDGTIRAGDPVSLARLLVAMVGAYRADESERGESAAAGEGLSDTIFIDMVRRAFAAV